MLVHRCDRCCVYKKEIQPCRTKYRGIWAICMHKMMFPSESCNSVLKGTFREFRPFSVIGKSLALATLAPPPPRLATREGGGTKQRNKETTLACDVQYMHFHNNSYDQQASRAANIHDFGVADFATQW